MNKKILIVKMDTWEGLYIDGKLVKQEHSITKEELLKALGVSFSETYIEDPNEQVSSFPGTEEELFNLINEFDLNTY